MALPRGKTHLADILPVLLLFLCSTDRAFSQEKPYDLSADKNPPGIENNANHSVAICAITQESGKTFFLFPPGDLYPYYVADPYQIGFAFKVQNFMTSSIPGVGDSRFYLRTGGNIGVIRYQPPDQGDRGWQLNIKAGFDGQFDNTNSQDNVGWNGNYGLVVSMKPFADWAFRFGALHVSSHIGDEYILRTGQPRIGYTREEFAGSASWEMNKQWRVYGEGGWAYHVGNKTLMEPARLQAGLEYESDKNLWRDILGWYTAVDVSSWEERDWQIDIAAHVGLLLHSAGRKVRFGVEYYDGRSPIGEFFQYDEKYICLGIWMDI